MSGILDKYILRELGEVSAHTRGNLQEAWVECQSMYCGCTQRETKGQWKRNRKTLKIISLTLYFCLELAIVTIYPQMKEWIQFSSFIMKRKRFFCDFLRFGSNYFRIVQTKKDSISLHFLSSIYRLILFPHPNTFVLYSTSKSTMPLAKHRVFLNDFTSSHTHIHLREICISCHKNRAIL